MDLKPTKTWCIYCVTNLANNKKYVGQTCTSPSIRWRKHRYLSRKGANTRFYEAIRKYSDTQFRVSILQENLTSIEDANAAEARWVTELRTLEHDYGYNMTTGGDQQVGEGWKMSPDACKKISDSKRGKLLHVRRAKTAISDKPIVDAYLAGKTRSQIVAELHVTRGRVEKALWRHKERVDPTFEIGAEFHYRNASAASRARNAGRNKQIIRMVCEEGKTRQEVADQLGLTYGLVKTLINRYKRENRVS